MSLLTRLYDCTSGSVRIDGADVKEINIRSLRRIIGTVQQEVIFAKLKWIYLTTNKVPLVFTWKVCVIVTQGGCEKIRKKKRIKIIQPKNRVSVGGNIFFIPIVKILLSLPTVT